MIPLLAIQLTVPNSSLISPLLNFILRSFRWCYFLVCFHHLTRPIKRTAPSHLRPSLFLPSFIPFPSLFSPSSVPFLHLTCAPSLFPTSFLPFYFTHYLHILRIQYCVVVWGDVYSNRYDMTVITRPTLSTIRLLFFCLFLLLKWCCLIGELHFLRLLIHCSAK